MKNQFSDEQLDQILKSAIRDSALPPESLDEIADSPQLWWGIQRQVVGRKPARGWLPTFDWRVLVFASMLIAVAGIAFMRSSDDRMTIAFNRPDSSAMPIASLNVKDDNNVTEVAPEAVPVVNRTAVRTPKTIVAKRNVKSDRTETVADSTEIKSDFIALMYAPESESGQIVKVKVPRTMMVSLGVSTEVQGKSEFVNAEVLMGDDGSARAIRFLQK